jgi:hypothetical protein
VATATGAAQAPTVTASGNASAGVAAGTGADIRVGMVAGPKLSLTDHLLSGVAATDIRAGGWDIVVLQEGPDADLAARDSLILRTERFDTIIRSVGARPALYMIWPPAGDPGEFCATDRAYQAAATAVHGVFLPAGRAWLQALKQDPTLGLYDPDGVHPAPLGTFLAAITIYEVLTGRDARLLAPTATVDGTTLSVPTATVRMLQGVAHAASSGSTTPARCSIFDTLGGNARP